MIGINWNDILKGVNTWNGWLVAGLIVITLNTAASEESLILTIHSLPIVGIEFLIA